MASVSSKLMWIGFALFTFGLVLSQLVGGSVVTTAIVFIGVIAYLLGAFEVVGELHDVESKRFVNTRTDILFAHIDENDKLMLTGLGIFLLGSSMVVTGSLPVSYGFIAALGGLLMYVGGLFSFNADLELLRRRAER
jgi:hypothetical protein